MRLPPRSESAGAAPVQRMRAPVPALGARAYTQGTEIHFAPGQYRPGSEKGQALLASRDERTVGAKFFNDEIETTQDEARRFAREEGVSSPNARREADRLAKLDKQKRNIPNWIPEGIDTGDLYEFVKKLNDNMLKHVRYIRKYNPSERVIETLSGDCRSMCETLKFIAEGVLGASGVEIESAKDGIRVAGSNRPDDAYTNHHWININGRRLDAMGGETSVSKDGKYIETGHGAR